MSCAFVFQTRKTNNQKKANQTSTRNKLKEMSFQIVIYNGKEIHVRNIHLTSKPFFFFELFYPIIHALLIQYFINKINILYLNYLLLIFYFPSFISFLIKEVHHQIHWLHKLTSSFPQYPAMNAYLHRRTLPYKSVLYRWNASRKFAKLEN